jgi:predicted restriction endonuclease
MENIRKNMKQSLYALLIAGTIGSISACSNERKNVDTSSSTNTAYEGGVDAETVDRAENTWMKERDTYVSTQRTTLERIDADMKSWKNNMEAKGNAAMKEGMKSLQLKRDQFEDQLNEIEQSTEENWTRVRSELDEKALELERTHEAFTKEYGKNS